MQKSLVLILFCLALTACVYVPDIQQGNMVTQEKLAQLELGMDKRQVLYVMGPPLLTDPFHQQRWDYYYSLTPGRKDTLRYSATLYFEDERLARIEARGEIPPVEYPEDHGAIF